MNNEEIQALMNELKEKGYSAEDIADGILWPLFRDGKMSKEDLATLCSALGLELDPEFEKDEGPKTDLENISEKEVEEAKEVKPGETKEDFEEKIDKAVSTDKDEDEDEEWERARKLYKL